MDRYIIYAIDWFKSTTFAYTDMFNLTEDLIMTSINECYTLKQLKQRGWTNSLIKAVGLSPHLLVENYLNPNWPPTQLYLKSEVHRMETTDRFKEAYRKVYNRILGAKKASKTKKEKKAKN